MNSIGKRIKHLRTTKGLSMAELEDEIGSSRGSVNQWEKERSIPGGNSIVALSEFFQVPTDWILKGTGEALDEYGQAEGDFAGAGRALSLRLHATQSLKELFNEAQSLPEDEIELLKTMAMKLAKVHTYDKIATAREDRRIVKETSAAGKYGTGGLADAALSNADMVPIWGEAAAGEPIEAIRMFEGYLGVPEEYKRCFAVRVKGRSMVGAGITDSGYAIIRQQDMVNNNEIALVMVENRATIKRFKLSKEHATLVSENEEFEPMVYHRSQQMQIVGKVVHFISAKEAVIAEP
ncbi:helix-turn-helix domain-containing protein [Paenibacillus sp. MBLB4367]|uniref:helix-turn-helix domain-containing protein n=1 Tax=Paenibacillus sp. MBLB4367 TaxID=3384767 RepID=UPI0039081689